MPIWVLFINGLGALVCALFVWAAHTSGKFYTQPRWYRTLTIFNAILAAINFALLLTGLLALAKK